VTFPLFSLVDGHRRNKDCVGFFQSDPGSDERVWKFATALKRKLNEVEQTTGLPKWDGGLLHILNKSNLKAEKARKEAAMKRAAMKRAMQLELVSASKARKCDDDESKKPAQK